VEGSCWARRIICGGVVGEAFLGGEVGGKSFLVFVVILVVVGKEWLYVLFAKG
jgi:hypothetical protein